MFKKKECKNCRKKIEEKYKFCPYCGFELGDNTEEEGWGMIGKDDNINSLMNNAQLPMGFNTIFNSLIKNLSKEMDSQLKENIFDGKSKKIKKDGLSISISTFGNGTPRIRVNSPEQNQKPKQQKNQKKFRQIAFTKERIKKFSSLPKEEIEYSIRRLSDGVIYELKIPGVKSMEDISIIQMENSIEIKAISKNKAYAKVIPIGLPITNHALSEGILTLELGIKN